MVRLNTKAAVWVKKEAEIKLKCWILLFLLKYSTNLSGKLKIFDEVLLSPVQFINCLRIKQKQERLLSQLSAHLRSCSWLKAELDNLLSLDLFCWERALLMDVQRLRPQRAVSPFRGGWTWSFAASFEGHPWWLGITWWHWLQKSKGCCYWRWYGVSVVFKCHSTALTWMVWPKRRTAPFFEGDIKLTRDETLASDLTRLLLGS